MITLLLCAFFIGDLDKLGGVEVLFARLFL